MNDYLPLLHGLDCVGSFL